MVVSLSQQVRALIDEAPVDLQPAIAQIAPVLQQVANDLSHQSYFIGQNHQQEWIVITLENQQKIQKRSVYAFSQQKDAISFLEPDELTIELPVIDLLFQLLALETIDQLIFFDQPGDVGEGRTVSRGVIQQAIARQLQQNSDDSSQFC